jgi:hypothetical protein
MGKIYLTESELEKLIKTVADALKDEKKTKALIQSILDKFKKKKPNKKEESSNSSSDNSSDSSSFIDITKKVIDKFEGGYWHGPTVKNISTSKLGICSNHPSNGMGVSTETMFGLDRYNGGIESTSDGEKFFKIIDDEKRELGMTNFCKKWRWLYRGGDKEEELKTLAAKIMKNYFDSNMVNFVKDKKLKNKILNNKALLLHMSYASWNGPGFFQKFANSLQKGLNEGFSDNKLIDLAIKDRRNYANQQKVIDEIEKLR